MTKCYSPQPQEAYVYRRGSAEYYSADPDNPAAWNLVWLSLPWVDGIPAGTFSLKEAADGKYAVGVGALAAFSTFRSDEGVPLARLMGPSPTAFVQDLQDHFDLPALSFWQAIGGQTWIETMTARAYQSEGLADVYAAAAASTNVVLADFRLKRKVRG